MTGNVRSGGEIASWFTCRNTSFLTMFEAMLKDKRSRFFAILLTLLVLISSVCFYRLVQPNANGQAQVLVSNNLKQEIPPQGLLSRLNEFGITGGRARGGTFQAPAPAPSRSVPRSNSGYSEFPRSSYPSPYYSEPIPPRVIIPIPVPNSGYAPSPSYTTPTDDGLDIGFIFLLLVFGVVVLPFLLNNLRSGSATPGQNAPIGSATERLNDIVTVTQVQIALVAQARELQRDLTRLTTHANLGTQAGLATMLQETVLALLRSPQYWTHVWATSQTLRSREAGSRLFEQLSIAERSKFKSETLVNLSGQVRRQAITLPEDRDPKEYIVVTLLVGTADDRPLFDQVHSASELTAVLRRLGGISPDYLLVYELLWTPQDETDSLSREDLLTQYPSLISL
jgi:uncharacterized membrane protein